jgi:transcriptional regulator with XRE-family HTH domain
MKKSNEVLNVQIQRLQENLLSIRKIAGWTAEELGDKIGVTKQTISNLETGKAKLTQTQYIAIRSVIEFEMQNNKENLVLPQVISILFSSENFEDINEKKEAEIKTAIDTVAATAMGGITGAQLALVASAVLTPFTFALPTAIVGATLGWLVPFMKKKKRK